MKKTLFLQKRLQGEEKCGSIVSFSPANNSIGRMKSMMCMKKMVAGHRAACDMIGIAMGIALGYLAANALVNSCQSGRKMKKQAKKAIKYLENKLCC